MSENENRESVGHSEPKDTTAAPEAPAPAEASADAVPSSGPAEATPSPEATPSSEATPSPEVTAEPSAPAPADAATAAASTESDLSSPADASASADDSYGSGAGGRASAQGRGEGGDGEKKKRKRRRRKKKPKQDGGEAESSSRRDQAFARFFDGSPPRQHAFRAGEVVAGRVTRVEDGAIVVDLFGKALAIADILEPHEIPDPAPEPAAEATPEPAAEATEGAPPEAAAAPATGSSPEPRAEANADAAPASAAPDAAPDAAPADGSPAATAAGTPLADPAPAAAQSAEAATPAAEVTQAGEVPAAATEGADASEAKDVPTATEGDAEGAPEVKAKASEPAIEPSSLEPEGPHPEPPAVGAIFRGRVSAVAESGHIALVNRNIERPRAKAAIRLAHDERRRVPGVVFGYNRGGFDVLVAGIRCFAPASGMALGMVEDPETLIGRKLEFTVPKVKGGKSIVVTRRSLLEREARADAKARMDELKVGEVIEGTVTDVRDYGALVDIGGIDGLVHMSEIAWTRGGKPSDHVSPGDKVKVEVLKVQKMSRKDRYGKVSLSIRKCLPDPWEEHQELLQPGQPRKGKVVSLTDFGAFLELAPGIEGLLHISELEGKPAHAKDVLSEGEELDILIDRKDEGQRRLSLSLLTKSDLKAIESGELDLSVAPRSTKVGANVTVIVERIESHGLMVQVKGLLGKRGRGYVPGRELPEEGERKKRFGQGTEHEMKIIGTDREGRLRLSVRGKERDEERKAVQSYRKEAATKGFGTFGDLLKSKLDK